MGSYTLQHSWENARWASARVGMLQYGWISVPTLRYACPLFHTVSNPGGSFLRGIANMMKSVLFWAKQWTATPEKLLSGSVEIKDRAPTCDLTPERVGMPVQKAKTCISYPSQRVSNGLWKARCVQKWMKLDQRDKRQMKENVKLGSEVQLSALLRGDESPGRRYRQS